MNSLTKLKHILLLSTIATLVILPPNKAFASQQRIVVKKNSNFFLACNNIIADIRVKQLRDLPPHLTITITNAANNQNSYIQLFDIAKDKLLPEHYISIMKVGCITRDGGIGINFPGNTNDTPDVKIQIDAKGRVFYDYDKAGLKLVMPEN